jgi:S-formylglutathione hydrolase FrmB
MTAALIVLLVLSALTMCTPHGAQARAEIRDTARTNGWAAVAPAGRHLLRHTLLLLVEVLHLLLGAVAFVGGVLALAANRLETTGATGRSA